MHINSLPKQRVGRFGTVGAVHRATATLTLITQFGGINPATAGAASSIPGGSVYRSEAYTNLSCRLRRNAEEAGQDTPIVKLSHLGLEPLFVSRNLA